MLDRFSKLSASANLCNSTSTPGSGCRAATVRAAMEVMGEALALTPFKCMSTVFKLMDNAQKSAQNLPLCCGFHCSHLPNLPFRPGQTPAYQRVDPNHAKWACAHVPSRLGPSPAASF